MDTVTGPPSPVTTPRSSSRTPLFPVREDHWTEDATFTLIDAWGERHLSLNRGNLRQKHWEEVADAVNDRHFTADNPKSYRSDVQCKNRLDTLKKKYKIEKGRVSDSNGAYTSPWPFFSLLDSLIVPKSSPLPPPPPPPSRRKHHLSPLPWNFPVARRSATVKRPAPEPAVFPSAGDDSWSSRTLDFSAFAEVAAAAAEAEESGESERWRRANAGMRGREKDGGIGELAMAIERFAEVYERVERKKQTNVMELEKSRMQFIKDSEYYKMEFFTDTMQHQLRKIKRAKGRSSSSPSPENYL